jgi:hypothetical protein
MYVQGDAYHKEHMQASIGDYEFNDRRSERRGRSKTSSTKLSSTKLSPTYYVAHKRRPRGRRFETARTSYFVWR